MKKINRVFNRALQVLFGLFFILFYYLLSMLDATSLITDALLAPICAYFIVFIAYELFYSKTHGSDKYRKYLDAMIWFSITVMFSIVFVYTSISLYQAFFVVVIIIISLIFSVSKLIRMNKLNLELVLTILVPILSTLISYFLL